MWYATYISNGGMAHNNSQSGFTLIEVLIVLAIAALVLLIVFLAVPAARRVERDNTRKAFVSFAAAQLDEYYQNNSREFPYYAPDMCEYFTNYLKDQGVTSCAATFNVSKQCVLVNGYRIKGCFHHIDSDHDYVGPYDEVSIQLGHNCNSVAGGDPIVSAGGVHIERHYAVWTRLEGGSILCVDNYRD